MPKLIIAVTGMPGAGKSTVANAISQLGFHPVSMGDAVRKETVRRKLRLADANVGAVMVRLRRERGPGAIAELVLPEITRGHHEFVIVDGLRSVAEAEVFKRVCNSRLLAVHASPLTRFRFLFKRGREDAPASWNYFKARDERELSVGVGEAIALADEVLSNNNISLKDLRNAATSIAKRWMMDIED